MAAFASCICIILSTSFLILPSSSSPSSGSTMLATETPSSNSTDFIRSKCNSTDYPSLCMATLSSYAPTVHDSPLKLADAALNVSLDSARSASAVMSRLSHGGGPGAWRDCAEALEDSVTYLRQSLKEMGGLVQGEPGERMDDVRTWVSTALTDESACMDGFGGDVAADDGGGEGGSLKGEARGRVLRVAQLTSNALALLADLIATTQSP